MLISDYRVAWNINRNVGEIKVKYANANQFTTVPLSNASEFIAVLTILQGPGQAEVQNGWLFSK